MKLEEGIAALLLEHGALTEALDHLEDHGPLADAVRYLADTVANLALYAKNPDEVHQDNAMVALDGAVQATKYAAGRAESWTVIWNGPPPTSREK